MCHTEKTARRLGDDSKTQARKVHKNSNDKMKAKTRKTRQYVSTLQSAIPPATPSIRTHEHHIPDARTWAEHRRGKCQIATKRKQNRQIAPESGSGREEMCIFAPFMSANIDCNRAYKESANGSSINIHAIQLYLRLRATGETTSQTTRCYIHGDIQFLWIILKKGLFLRGERNK